MQNTFGIIKPESLTRKLDGIILQRIIQANLEIVSLKNHLLNKKEFEMIYGKVVEPSWLHQAREEYLISNPVILLKIKGEDAVKKLLDVRGYSNPKYALPGTLRGDFARDQDYETLREQKKMALNLFHAADSEGEAMMLIENFRL